MLIQDLLYRTQNSMMLIFLNNVKLREFSLKIELQKKNSDSSYQYTLILDKSIKLIQSLKNLINKRY